MALRGKSAFHFLFAFSILLISIKGVSQQNDSVSNWTVHFQSTVIYQSQSSFHAKYSGLRSLDTNLNEAYSLTNTLFLGRRLWRGASFYFNPEISGGQGIGKVLGIAGAPNGEVYRVGNPKPTLFIARGYLQQEFALKKSEPVDQEDGQNQLRGKVASDRLVLQIGKFGISDFFDGNVFDHDARSQFLNWSLMSSGAWDFPADLRGYTEGVVVQWLHPDWALRFAAVKVPLKANGLKLDPNITKGNSETAEYEKNFSIHHRKGSIKLTGFVTSSRAPIYNKAIAELKQADSTRYKIINGENEWNIYEGVKYGLALNFSQSLSFSCGLFSRLNFNDGQSATWAFTEIDRNFQIGVNINGTKWKRKDDALGVALSINGLSPQHKKYLQSGGMGFIIGDGKLNYSKEAIIESFYRIKCNSFIYCSADYQLVINPGYNKDRKGPVSICGIRLHIEI